MRTLIYARYSSAHQNDRSCADQIADCRARAAREGWTVIGEHADHAISGAAGIAESQRPGLSALLARVEAGGVEQLLCESTDRLARHQGDDFAVRELLDAAGVRLFTLMEGEVDEITGTFKGLMNARFRKDLGARVKRGHRGVIAQGRASAGVAYGYRKVAQFDEKGEQVRGLREVDEDKAEIVRRIYREYLADRSLQQIVTDLNAEGVPPPRRGIWRPGTLVSYGARGFGILVNPIYVGRIQYGRSRQIVDPRTRQRRSTRGIGAVEEGLAPHLRIVDDATFEAVRAAIERRAAPSPQAAQAHRRPRHVLSGLGVCGVCGGGWVIVNAAGWGCSNADAGGTCVNRRQLTKHLYEQRVLAELKGQMLAPDAVAAYLREYHREHARRSGELTRDRGRLDRQLAEAERKLARLVAVIAEGGGEFAELRGAMAAARDDRDRLRSAIAGLEALPILTLHPGLADEYRRQVEELEVSLADPNARLEAIPRLRVLIDRIVVTPAGENTRRGGVDIEVVRRIDEVLNLATAAPPRERLAQR